jgi:hypothetical protein
MGYTVPTSEPLSLRSGDTWAWRRDDLGDWPASLWTLTYSFRNATSHFDITASADGEGYSVAVAAAASALYAAGAYTWYAFVSDGTDRHQVGTGRLDILPNITAAAYDGRSWARRMLDYVEAALEGRASSDQLDLVNAQMADRGITRDRGGLMTLRSQLAVEVQRAEQPAAAARKSRVVVRFGAAG